MMKTSTSWLSARRTTISAALVMSAVCSLARADSPSLDRVLGVSAEVENTYGLSETRLAALKELGRALGIRAGLADRSAEIVAEVEKDKVGFDTDYNFGKLTFPSGALPPVIEKAQGIISVMDYTMTVAGIQYKIIAPATFNGANWRDYLYLGLVMEKDPILNDAQRAVYPRDANEKKYWDGVVRAGYHDGRIEAQRIYEVNLNRLKRDKNGMSTFYELVNRGLVQMPVIATATQTLDRPDPNTIIIGKTVIRITKQSEFEVDVSKWKTRQ